MASIQAQTCCQAAHDHRLRASTARMAMEPHRGAWLAVELGSKRAIRAASEAARS